MSNFRGNITPKHDKKISHIIKLWKENVRDGDWFTWYKIGFSSLFAALMLTILLSYLLLMPNNFTSPNGTFMMDYLSFWLAGQQALSGTPEIVYNLSDFAALQNQISESDTVFAFFYPPAFQLFQIPYALLPLKISHIIFIATTTFLLWWALRMIMGNGLWAASLVVMPACLNNAMHGQNAALTAALLALFLIGLENKKPVLAGIALGILTIKPQLGVLAPFALIASANWRCFISASATTLVLACLSLVILGSGVWFAFIEQIPAASEVMKNGVVEWGKMISFYGSLRQLGINHVYSLALQTCVALTALVCVWFSWQHSQQMVFRAPALIAGSLLATPFALSYDLTLLIVPCAFLIREGLKQGFLPYEKAVLAVFIILSSTTGPIAIQFGVPIAPLLPFSILFLGMRRFLHKPALSDQIKFQSAF